MPRARKGRSPVKNHLLANLAREDYKRLRTHLELVQLSLGDVVYGAEQSIQYIYFPLTAMLSWVVFAEDGRRVEVGETGWEGMIGAPMLLGYGASPYVVEAQVAGSAIRVKADVFIQELDRSPSMKSMLLRYVHVVIVQLAQTAACNRFHAIEQRMCRWLLAALDRAESKELMLTHEMLAGYIGSHRSDVTIVVGTLQTAGLIRAARAKIIIVNRAGLETVACECYRIIREQTAGFLENR